MTQTLQLLAACALGALLMYGYLFLRGRGNAEVKRLQAKLTAKTEQLERDAHRLVGEGHFHGALEERRALDRSTPKVAAVRELNDEMPDTQRQ